MAGSNKSAGAALLLRLYERRPRRDGVAGWGPLLQGAATVALVGAALLLRPSRCKQRSYRAVGSAPTWNDVEFRPDEQSNSRIA